jgi:hypothetical protein
MQRRRACGDGVIAGQIIMVKRGGVVEAHEWSASDGKWSKIGVVEDAKQEQAPPGWHYFPIELSGKLRCSHAPMLPCSHAPMLPCSHAPMLPCSHAPMLPCSHAPMLPCWLSAAESHAGTLALSW